MTITACRSCAGPLTRVLDLGNHYLPDFVAPGTSRGHRYPLDMAVCDTCSLLQLTDTVNRDLLYHDRYGFRSGTNEAIRNDLADIVGYASAAVPDAGAWLDIACNDGTLLSYVPRPIRRVGCDPVIPLATEAARIADTVISDYFRPYYFSDQFDVITSVSMFYDLDDPNDFVSGVARVLHPTGAWVIQQNYAADMLANNAVDNICHEHVTYFSVTSLLSLLLRHGLEVNDVTYSDVNGGCVRTLVSHFGARPVLASVADAIRREGTAKLARPETWRAWGNAVKEELQLTRDFLVRAKEDGKRVYLYGASTRGGTFLQMIGAGPDLLPYAVERNLDKVGKIMASTGIPIIAESTMRSDQPDALLVSPWFFRDVFLDRERFYLTRGGRMVFPLPRFEIVGDGKR